ncbi:hypothetical protein [Helicobacter bizzozeronii]|uniref:hypothetical protein n=1 Tax=Helicobacter bizzozeronii TaxID=56877 RepID=UPI0018F82764|nr:hypothetical protein [Helicobacter bizzozeronii]
MKKIVVNASILLYDLTGLGYYTLTLIKALEKHFENKDDVSIQLVVKDGLYHLNLFNNPTLWRAPMLFDNLEDLEKFRSLSLSLSLLSHLNNH